MAKENKTKTTNPPVVLKVYDVESLSMKQIDMYIDHDRSVGGLFLEYIGVFCVKVKRNSGSTRADMFTRACPSKRQMRQAAFSFVPR